MNKILTIMWKDVNILFRDWAALVLIIAGPLVLSLGLGLVTGSFGGDDTPAISRIPVAVVNHDGGQFGDALAGLLSSPDLSELLASEAWDDEAAARAAVERGDMTAAVIIPAGFSRDVSAKRLYTPDAATGQLPAPVPVQVIGDPGAPIGASVVRGIVDEFAARAQTGVTAIEVALTELAASGAVPPAELSAVGEAMGAQLFGEAAGGEAMAASSLVRVTRESATPSGSAGFNPLAYFAPAMALLFLMYAVTLGARTLLSERREGTLARMLVAPVTNGQVLSGKVAGIFLGGFIQLGALILLTTLLFRLNWGNPLGVLLLIVAAALAATGWGVLIASAAANAGQVTSLGMALTLIFGILGGSFAPLQDVSPLLDQLSRITPNRWAMDGFTGLASGDGLAAVALPVGVLLAMAVVLFAVSAFIFRRRQGAMIGGQ
ncbi:ABC transporter permease [Promineifilum sp.]|uniref:ABC transporter permease n=1 Tax=Promineifilum sp. TaxID=2664178 RepID=UPI0035ADDFB8